MSMVRVAAVLSLMLATAALNGCSTMASVCLDNQDDGKGKCPYGGTTRLVEVMNRTLFADTFIAIPNSRVLCFAFQVCDLPLSVAADTVLLPFTVPYTLANPIQPSTERQSTREELEPSQQVGPLGQIPTSQEEK
jgi:uncharacterized protein YceK